MVDWLMEQLVDWITSGLTAALDVLLAVMDATLLFLPDVTQVVQVRSLWSHILGITNVAYVIAIIAGFAIAMTYETVQVQYALKDIAPRLVFGAVAANLSLDWCQRLLTLGQELLEALAEGFLGDVDPAATVHAQVDGAVADSGAATALISVVLGALVVFLVVAVLFGWIVRFGVLLVLVISAPLALACHSLPQLDGVARLWWRALIGTMGVQVLQALVLLAGIGVFLTPAGSIADQVQMSGSGIFNLLVLTALLWCAVKTPGLVRAHVMHSGQRGGGAYLVRVLLVDQIARRAMRLRRA